MRSFLKKQDFNKLLALFLLSLLIVTGANAQTVFTVAKADGYGGKATGGGNATPKTVTTAADFISAVGSSSAAVIIVKGNLSVGAEVKIKSNKTIIGADKNATITGNLQIRTGDNIIIQNLNITNKAGEGTADGLEISESCTNIFIHKCTFIDCKDGSLDVKRGSDYVTVSWCEFIYPTIIQHHNYANLCGHSDANGSMDRGKLHVTYHHCYYHNHAQERMPRVRFGTVHVYNNYCEGPLDYPDVDYAIGIGVESSIYVENCAFTNISNLFWDWGAGGTPGKIHWENLCLTNSVVPTWAVNASLTKPTYSYTLDDQCAVKSLLSDATYGAGNKATPTSPIVYPSVSVTAPLNNASVLVNQSTTITADASISKGTISSVEFFIDGASIATDNSAPYSTSWTPTKAGSYKVTAVATSNTGTKSTSSEIAVTVTAAIVLPTLTLTSGPATQTVTSGTSITSIVYTWGGGATDVTVTGLPSGLTATKNTSAKTVTIAGTPSATGTFTLTTVQSSGTAVVLTGTITVDQVKETVQLRKGWNYIGCPLSGSTAIDKALSSIWSHVLVVKNLDSFYDKSSTLNSLSKADWGVGYMVKVDADCILTW